MKMAQLSRSLPNISFIGEVCDRLGTVRLSSYGGNHWATSGLRTPVHTGGTWLFPPNLLSLAPSLNLP